MSFDSTAVLTLFLGSGFFLLGILLGTRPKSRSGKVVLGFAAIFAALPGSIYALYYFHLFDDAIWYYNLRILPNTEFLPCGLGFSGGLLFAYWKPESFWQKLAIPSLTLIAMLIPFAKSPADPLDYAKLAADCPDGVCMQSTPSTCGPSSAATILNMYGDSTSERELARSAFTSRGGTEIWYLARVLQRKGYSTRVVIQKPEDHLPTLPAIAGVVLGGGGGHFIALLSNDHEKVTIADPLKGKFQVPSASLSKEYRFTGFFLTVRRN